MARKKKVFISCAGKDADEAKRIADCLEEHGLSVWIFTDGQCVGRDLGDTIRAAIKQANFVIFVITLNSIRRAWIRDESRNAANAHKARCGVVLDQCNYERSKLWERVKDGGGWTGQHRMSENDLREFCDNICRTLGGHSGYRGEERREIEPKSLPPAISRGRTYHVHSDTFPIDVSLDQDAPGYELRKMRVAAQFGNPVGAGRWKLTLEQFEAFKSILGEDPMPKR